MEGGRVFLDNSLINAYQKNLISADPSRWTVPLSKEDCEFMRFYKRTGLLISLVQRRVHSPHHHSSGGQYDTAGLWPQGGALGRLQRNRGVQVTVFFAFAFSASLDIKKK
jgi:hypothetical protein